MSVRARVVLAFAIFVVPATLLVLYGSWSARRRAALEAVYAATIERMESGGREVCEADPARFGRGAARGRHREARRRGRAREGPMPAARIVPYDASYRSADPRAPALAASLRRELESGETIAAGARDGARVEVAMRMPWSEGPCAVLVVTRRAPALASGERGLARELGLAALVLLAALAVALIALGPPLSRLRRLADAVRASPAPSFAIPKGVGGSDEIGAVARALDEASARVREHVDRLEARDRALTSYVDATTHDLAIPLTVLQSRLAELDARLRSAPAGEGTAIEPGALGPALAECEYLGQLVSNMAAAARLGSGAPAIERHPVDLAALIERVVERHRPLARHQGVVLDHAVPPSRVIVEGDDILLERAISNLVHNAIRHGARKRRAAGEEGHVAVLLERHADAPRFRLVIADDGSDADLARVASGLDARSEGDSRNARARGLGLRIVRAVVDAHAIQLALAKTEEGGLEVKLEGAASGE